MILFQLVTNGRVAGAAVLFVALCVSLGIALGQSARRKDWQSNCPHCGRPNARWQGDSR